MAEEMAAADEVIVIAVTDGVMKLMSTDAEAGSVIAHVAVAHHMLVSSLTGAMFPEAQDEHLNG